MSSATKSVMAVFSPRRCSAYAHTGILQGRKPTSVVAIAGTRRSFRPWILFQKALQESFLQMLFHDFFLFCCVAEKFPNKQGFQVPRCADDIDAEFHVRQERPQQHVTPAVA